MIRYEIRPHRPEAHLFEVRVSVDSPDPQGDRFALPAWIPGSYMIREFARHVVAVSAAIRGRPMTVEKIDKHTWRVLPAVEQVRGPLEVTLEVFAHDASVRGAWLDTRRGFFNGPCMFPRVLGREDEPCEVVIHAPRGARYRAWKVATAMPPVATDARGFGRYRAADYAELIDHPVELGTFTSAGFRAGGVPHVVVIAGVHRTDTTRLCRDLRRLCEHHIRFFGQPAPMKRYVFLVNALAEGYGGLEHRASTALVCARDELPRRGTTEKGEGYRTFLGLASHEYFHTWNVKRIKPAVFSPYDLDRENHTTLLWAFEGITSYYDDLALVRCGLVSREQYLTTLARAITSLARTPGRLRQSVAEASWDAWIKYYRQDENSPNALVSYYLKGSLVALCLDAQIRSRTSGRRSLDDVMRALWRRYGKTGKGVEEDGIERLAEAVTGLRLRTFFDRTLRSTRELPLAAALRVFGLDLRMRPTTAAGDRGGCVRKAPPPSPSPAPVSLGVRTAVDGREVKISHVLEGGAAQAAGIAPGDVLVAMDGLRATAKSFDQQVAGLRPGESIRIHAFRGDELFEATLDARAAPRDTCDIVLPERASRALDRWLGRGR